MRNIPEKELKNLINQLCYVAKRNVTNWQEHLEKAELATLRAIWNDGLPRTDSEYWHFDTYDTKGDN